MAQRRRYYSDDDEERGITPSELKRAGRQRQMEYVRHWFERNFEDPANETPYSSEDGGYLYVWGGPYDAREQLYDEFGQLVPADRIEEVADQVEAHGILEWAAGPDHPDQRQAQEDWLAEQEADASQAEDLNTIITRLRSGVKPKYGDGYEQEQRQAILERLHKLQTDTRANKVAARRVRSQQTAPRR